MGGLDRNPDQWYRNDQYDALRHAYTSALLADRASAVLGDKPGADVAKWLGDTIKGFYAPNGAHRDAEYE
jgi:hypothetical protein